MFIAFRVFFNARFYYPVFTVLFLDFGLSLSQFALLNAVWAASIVLLEVPSGALADMVGRRSLLVFASSTMFVEILILCVVPRTDPWILFAAFLVNRLLSGAAEAAASGADEALAYDSLLQSGMAHLWPKVLVTQMRVQAAGFVVAMSIGAAVYDPALMQKLAGALGMDVAVDQAMTIRFPLYLTLAMAAGALFATVAMREPGPPRSHGPVEAPGQGRSVSAAISITLRAGSWIWRTPFALVVILAGMMFDHVIRMIVTMSSQYYRIIEIPEALFGVIGSVLAMLGFFVPRLAYEMTDQRSPTFNLAALSLMTFAGLGGLTFFVPLYGLVPMVVLVAAMQMNGFFVSNYLNRITDSRRRATVLSFKGLSFNLAYGAIGILYSLLFSTLRAAAAREGLTGAAAKELENVVFIQSVGWFPGYFFLTLAALLVFARLRLNAETAFPTRSAAEKSRSARP